MSKDKKIYLMGNAHLDPAWYWKWQEGYAEVKATFRSALDRLDRFEDFVFTCACVCYYKWIEEDEPEMFEEIQKYVKEGRWQIAGGWWIQPDCNLPSGESFARHGLYGQRYFKKNFGKIARTGYNVDSFGHNGNLPQILRKSGMENYLFMRPSEWEKHLEKSLFEWQSQDGSSVLAIRLSTSYTTLTVEDLKKSLESIKEGIEKEETDLILAYGVGNHGGGPTVEMIEYLNDRIKRESEYTLIYSGPDRYFDAVRETEPDIPLIKEDMQHHASGCYSANSEIKKQNRVTENKLKNAEKYASMAHILTGKEYTVKEIRRGWENVMFNHFHDLLCGCSSKVVSDAVMDFYGESKLIADRLSNKSIGHISYRIDTLKGEDPFEAEKILGRPVVVFNPLCHPVKIPVKIDSALVHIGRYDNQRTQFSAQNGKGEVVAVQHTQCGHLVWDARDGIFMAEVEAFGYALYYINPVDEQIESGHLRVYKEEDCVFTHNTVTEYGKYIMENRHLRIEIDRFSGGISKFYNKKSGTTAFEDQAAIGKVMDDTENDTWGHGQEYFRDIIGTFSDASVKIVEEGPVRCVVRSETVYGGSRMVQDFILYEDSGELETHVKLEWREKHKSLKLSFPANVKKPTGYYEIPFGHIQRNCTGQEEPGLNWFAVVGENAGNPYSVALLNDSKYSFSIKDSEMQIMVARSCLYADHGGIRHEGYEYDYLDWGTQTFKYVIKTYPEGLDIADVTRRAEELNTEFEIVKESFHGGYLKSNESLITVPAKNVIINVVKRSEDDDGFIVRAYETSGKSVKTKIGFKLLNMETTTEFKPYEIKTLKFGDDKRIRQTDFLEFSD